jgi:hypothetical protein
MCLLDIRLLSTPLAQAPLFACADKDPVYRRSLSKNNHINGCIRSSDMVYIGCIKVRIVQRFLNQLLEIIRTEAVLATAKLLQTALALGQQKFFLSQGSITPSCILVLSIL